MTTATDPRYFWNGFSYSYTDVEALRNEGLVALYNQLTDRATKKFASRAKGVQQTWDALVANGALVQKVPAGQTAAKARKAQAGRARQDAALAKSRARAAKKAKAPAEQRVARSPEPVADGPMAVALGLLGQAGGAHLDDLVEATGLPQRGVRSLIDRARRKGTKIENMGRKCWRVAGQ